MRIFAHSKSLAVSLLLGTMIVVPPMGQAATMAPTEGLTSSPLPQNSSEQTLCLNTLPNTHLNVYDALMPVQFERVNNSNGSGVVITQPKEVLSQAIVPSKTVLKKVTEEDLKEDIVTPAPLISPITTPVAGMSDQGVGSTTGVLNAEVIFNLVNATRAQYGLAPFQKDDRICAVVSSRAPEIDSEIWVTHTMHAGFYARNLPYWATENVISMRTEQEAVTWWLNSPVHRAALLGNYKYACVACAGRSCSMVFTNFDPKQAVPVVATSPAPTVVAGNGTPSPVTSIVSNVTRTVNSVTK